jgi:hypothetical protein
MQANPSTGLNVTPANCDTAGATVVVSNLVDAVKRSIGNCCIKQYCCDGAKMRWLMITLKYVQQQQRKRNVTATNVGPLSIDANGMVTVTANARVVLGIYLPIVRS